MAVHLVIGRSGTGKTQFCLDEIKEEMLQQPVGDPIVYLVPDQMTFSSEYKLITTPGLGGMIRTQVFSFSRLAWRVLQETGGNTRYHLNSVGINMLIRKIVEERKAELKLFNLSADKNGFIQQLEQMLVEFKRYLVRPEELLIQQQSEQMNNVLRDKLHDLELIYKHFEDALFGSYVDSEDYFKLLAEKIPLSHYLKDAEIYIDGFYSFTPQEYFIISQLMKHCKKVTITLTLDEPYNEKYPDELHLFRMNAETCQSLYEIARVEKLEIRETFFCEQKRWQHPSLKHLETFFDTRPTNIFKGETAVTIGQAVNRRAEIEGIAREILSLVRTKNYRYKDIAIMMRNGHEYKDLIETVFDDYEIPFFVDQKRTMLHHPVIELIRSTLEIINGYWRYEPVFQAVKTELLYPLHVDSNKLREQMDQLENFVLAFGIQGDKWTRRDRWVYRRMRGLELESVAQTDKEKEREQKLNELRLMISAPILRLSRRLKKAENGSKLAEALFLYLEELEIPAKLERWKITEEEKGELTKAREHDQAWNGVIELLDQFVEMLGDEKVSPKQFSKILDAGLEALQFSLVPPAMDQVLGADLEKSRLTDVKVAFIIGITEGVLPAKFSEDGIFADEDREQLSLNGLKIAASSKTRLLDEEFIAYKAFTTPSERLYVSYPLANSEGKALIASPYIKRMVDMFPDSEALSFMSEPSELGELDQLKFVAHENTALAYLTSQLQLKKRNYPIYDLWWDVYNYYQSKPHFQRDVRKVLSSLTYENRTTKLSEETSKDLYGEEIQSSVSRMEMFHSCPFSHFSQHGLKLRERQVFKLEAPDIGELFHAALKYITETIVASKLSWSDVSKDEMENLAKQAVDLLAPKLQNEILLSSNRHHYIKRKLEQIIQRASLILRDHAKASGFAPVGLELPFGPTEQIKPAPFTLKNGTKMELVGRIDRVDKAAHDGEVFLRILDYKSSAKDVNVNEIYYGLALQMLTYLDIIISNSESLIGTKASPAGVVYFHVHNPMISTSKMLTLDEIEAELFKKFKMNGLLLGEENVIKLMDQTLESGESTIISAGIKKDGSLTKRSKVASKEEFNQLQSYVRSMYVKTGNSIVDGAVQISPYKMKEKTPCTFCSFKSVCQFDESLQANKYRTLKVEDKETIIEKMRKESVENGEHETSTEAE
ncbi:helicase-exonuclease AddAB subunit AddB [Robertmurraya korlensis]|uniref:helicase-exonuclease AddAB subunit AddB n=1 Tax=Robertmurraya korlensis TaxID=519977 RepID=UPI00203A550E|nr:helicase-exonuclease AddAB subunit AddB [Robertmurraya korlensis]MCM3602329.1 helicase-exonuclease AddAB subunit AddB [Robertmurraya korlensis]